ncbi:MAG: Gfo/Idh/MocA family oxidoreductase [Planctomycetota bacterium]
MSDRSGIDRRDFLKGATAAALAFSALAHAQEEKKDDETIPGPPVKLGVIGVGGQGKRLLSELTKMESAKVVALCDIYPERFKKVLREMEEEPETYESHKDMLDGSKDMEAVLVATPLAAHAAICLDALQAGKHVFCESMLAYSIEDCKKVAQAAKASKQVFQVGHQRRCSPLYKHALKFVKTGILGELKQVRAQWHMNQSWRRPVREQEMEKAFNWRLYRESSRGLMGEFGSHQLDLVHWYMKIRPTAVAGFGGIDRWKDGRTVDDNVQAIFDYPGGVKMVFTSTLSNSFESYYELLIGTHASVMLFGEAKGLLFKEPDAVEMGWELYARKEEWGVDEGILLDADATKYQELKDGKLVVKVKEEDRPTEKKTIWRCELEDFCRSIRRQTPSACDAESALVTAAASIVADEAIQKQTVVKFTEDHFKV